MSTRWRDFASGNKKVALTFGYAIGGLPVCFVIQCLVRGWDHWLDSLLFSVVLVVVLGFGQYLMVRDPKP